MADRPAKIAVSGTHGTGKSTLCSLVSQRLREDGVVVAEVTEIPRRICDQLEDPDFFKRKNNSALRQLSVVVAQLVEEFSPATINADVIVCDRSVLDHFAYTLCLFGTELQRSNVENLLIDSLTNHCRSYDALLYLPPEIELEVDSLREDDSDFRNLVDRTLRDLFGSCGVRFHEISGSIAARVEASVRLINGLQVGEN